MNAVRNVFARRRELSDLSVRKYLSENPQFFARNSDILLDALGNVENYQVSSVSLMERLVRELHTRNTELQNDLQTLVDIAKENDEVLRRTKKITLSLIEAQNWIDLDDIIKNGLIEDFLIEHVVLFTEYPAIENSTKGKKLIYIRFPPSERTNGEDILKRSSPFCETWRMEEFNFWFGKGAVTTPGSVAVIPMIGLRFRGTLMFGSADPNRYAQSKGTLFLEHIRDVFVKTIDRIVE